MRTGVRTCKHTQIYLSRFSQTWEMAQRALMHLMLQTRCQVRGIDTRLATTAKEQANIAEIALSGYDLGRKA